MSWLRLHKASPPRNACYTNLGDPSEMRSESGDGATCGGDAGSSVLRELLREVRPDCCHTHARGDTRNTNASA